MRYSIGWSVNIVLLVLGILEAGLAIITGMKPEALGLSPVVVNWLLVVNGCCIAAGTLLPGLLKTPQEHANQQQALGRKRASDH